MGCEVVLIHKNVLTIPEAKQANINYFLSLASKVGNDQLVKLVMIMRPLADHVHYEGWLKKLT